MIEQVELIELLRQGGEVLTPQIQAFVDLCVLKLLVAIGMVCLLSGVIFGIACAAWHDREYGISCAFLVLTLVPLVLAFLLYCEVLLAEQAPLIFAVEKLLGG